VSPGLGSECLGRTLTLVIEQTDDPTSWLIVKPHAA
jgi:hypothetical protein